VDILLFQVGSLRCALPATDVREVLRALALGPLPSAPEVVLGVFSLRGVIVPVFDPHRRFGLPPLRRSHNDNVIVAQSEQRLVALWVDRVLDLHPLSDVSYLAAQRVAPEAAHLAGVVQLESDLVLICALERFLAQHEAVALDLALSHLATRTSHSP
jgi:purine-binding chemotaxis protein CheW